MECKCRMQNAVLPQNGDSAVERGTCVVDALVPNGDVLGAAMCKRQTATSRSRW